MDQVAHTKAGSGKLPVDLSDLFFFFFLRGASSLPRLRMFSSTWAEAVCTAYTNSTA